MSNQQVPNEPPPSYDYVLDQRRPHDTAPASSGQSGNAGTTSAPNNGGASTSTSTSVSNNAGPSTSTSTQQGAGSNATSGQNTGDKRKPKRGNSAHEELDVEEEDRPLPPGWVVQFSEKDDRGSNVYPCDQSCIQL